MKKQNYLKSMLCLLLGLVCHVAWADIDADGAVVTFTNVQEDGKEYALFINESNQLETSATPVADLGDAAKFRATRLEDGKWTFYNEAKSLYMIWRGNNGGYNNNTGVLGEYNSTYCDWSLYSGDASKMGTHYIVSKRNDGSTDGSIVIMNSGTFDKYGNSIGWATNYSNLYRIDIVELAANTMDYVYNVNDGAYAGTGWCKSWTSNNTAKPGLAITVDVNNINGGQVDGIGLRPGQAGNATYNVNTGCTMFSLSFEAKGTASHKISINGVEQAVGTEWKKFVINGINAATAQFILKGDNGNDCLLRNVRIVTPVLPFKAGVEELWENNPNTHFGRVRVTKDGDVFAANLTTAHLEEITHVFYSGGNDDVIDFTREYRGFEFQGFWAGEKELGKSFTLTEELKSSINDENPLIAKFTATDDVTLFYDDDEFSYRIPAIATTSTGRLIAVSDYRHCLDDIGMNRWGKGYRIDLVIRTSDDNGKTWSPIKTIAEGIDNSTADDCAYGDAAIAVVGEEVIVMAVAGSVQYGTGTAERRSRVVRVYSANNGEDWEKTDITEKVYGYENALYPTVYTAFFGSGKLAVDPDFNESGVARIYGSLLTQGKGNQVIYSDDKGLTWYQLGTEEQVANANEPKVEILPSGQILFSARRSGGRQFNVFTCSDKANNTGTWSGTANGCDNGGSNGTNGEIFCVDAKKPNGTAVKLLLQSQPKGGSNEWDRKDVTIWYKEIDGTSYTAADIAADWTEGLQVSNQKSAYSAMTMQKDGKVAFFFEEAPCYQDRNDWGYSMVYAPLTIENITKGNYFSTNTDLSTEQAVNVVFTDAEGNEYRDQLTCALNGIAEAVTAKYPFITLGDNTAIEYDGEAYTYTNTVTLPFKVSNEDNTVWYNIYFPSNTSNGYPIYLSASTADDTYVPKVTESKVYGNSTYNTADYADKISWAMYNANNSFTFKFKNKLTGKYIQVTGVATGNAQNTQYAEEANATAFELVPDAASYNGDYALKATVESSTGYLCSTSASYGYATHYTGNGHQGAWVKFVEAPDFETLIDQVNGVLNLFGDGLGQYTGVSEENLTAVNTAKSAMENAGSVKLNTLTEYQGYTSKTTGGTLNMPTNGQFFRVAYDYGSNVGKLYMQGVASTVKGVKFTAETGSASIWLYYDGALYSYTTGQCLREVGDDRGLQAVGGKTTATFTASTRVKGKYNIACTSYVHANSNNSNYYTDHCSGNSCAAHDLILEEVTSLPVTISAIGYATLYAPVALAIPEGVKAYTGALSDNNTLLTLTKLAEEIIPANTGVVLYRDPEGSAASTGATAHDFEIESSNEVSAESVFVGSVASIANSGTPYTLQTHEGGVAFKRFNGTSITGFKAYLNLPEAQAQAIRIRFGKDEGTTGIDNMVTTDNGQQSTVIYDLQGRRVLNPTKGMYIVNGKKVIR